MLRFLIFCGILLISLTGAGQIQNYKTTSLPLGDLQSFSNAPKNWKLAGGIRNSFKDTSLKTTKGTGVLYDDFSKGIQYKDGANLFTKLEHGDVFLSLDFLIPSGSNSGVYLQGRYEIQLFDSWLVKTPHVIDCGSIYERWDDSRPAGEKGFEGHPARVNASLAPNAWQHLEIEFQAPRFDAAGNKVKPARFVKVVLNGITIHENVVIFGPTRAAAFSDEAATGPLMIQGDHGPVAFRNINYALLNDFKANFKDVKYSYYEGKFTGFGELTKDKLTSSGSADAIDVKLADNPNALGLIFTGTLSVDTPDEYQFDVQRYGMTMVLLDGDTLMRPDTRFASRKLSAGAHTLQISYIKNFSWRPSKLGLFIGKTNSRPLALHVPASLPSEAPAPLIGVAVQDEPEIIRSFMEHQGKKKTHVISVGDPAGINYAYDIDQAGLLKVWRGEFLNVTEMWYERGEPQWAFPMGANITLSGRPVVTIVEDEKKPLPDSLNYTSDFIYKGYRLSVTRTPIFNYQYRNLTISDAMQPAQDDLGISRSITLSNIMPSQMVYIRVAAGDSIEKVGDNVYAIDDQHYFVQLPALDKTKAEIIKSNGRSELVIRCSASTTIQYSLIW
ncbi:MAG: DUF1080 domain-containing protein [Cyclobacteriaceae bacterium]|nr:DUF1080 domain-containing protein [Cyclobacteriaceae bacterium]MDH4295068.1 DUF1080 domain-containing protein [Cyclobacteriaceae bacterium]